MFIRKKKNVSGVISVQIIDKSSGRYQLVQTIGSSSDAGKVEELITEAKRWIQARSQSMVLDFEQQDKQIQLFFDAIHSVQLCGIEFLLGKIFDTIGFNQIPDNIFRQLVLYRLVYPFSKLKTTEYLYRYQQIDWDEDKVYRYLDKLYNQHKELVQQISYNHTVAVLGNQPQLVFYDVTTVYFEAEQEDELRRTGFSKEGKHRNPQIVLGLLVSQNGYPLAYDVFDGKKFEGHTLLPVLNSFKARYKLQQLVVVADAGLLSASNIALLQQQHYEFIIGARLKNEPRHVQQQILSHTYKNGSTRAFAKTGDIRLIISYSDKRAAKDATNRQRGLQRLEKQIKQGKLTKSSINNKGYNKYLKFTGSLSVAIDYDKYNSDAKWDGLKGYYTNSKLPVDEVIANYHHLWQIEKAFRLAKTDLKIRPVYHRLPRRIEAHICLTFAAYKVYKELERQLHEKKAGISPQKAIEIATFIVSVTLKLPSSKELKTKVLIKTEEQRQLAKIFNF